MNLTISKNLLVWFLVGKMLFLKKFLVGDPPKLSFFGNKGKNGQLLKKRQDPLFRN